MFADDSSPDSSCFSKSLWKKDGRAIASLMFLYVLQGIPLGLISAMPLLLTNKGITYEQQALFSLTFWPFSLKLLWAPFVDSLYIKSFGRRKSWLLPVQYLIGFFMLYISVNIDHFMDFGEGEDSAQKCMQKLTFVFFMLNFFAATQDIAVDGWCLTMLSKENVGWASTCNSVGQTAGWFIGNVIFLALESVDFSNNYFRPLFGIAESDIAIVTLPGFLKFWGIFFIVATTLVGVFKHEKTNNSNDDDFGLKETYFMLYNILKKRLIILYIFYALTSRIGFTVVDSISSLKMVENGMPKENLAMMAVPMIPIQIILPLIISKYTAGPRPLKIWYHAYLPRVFLGLVATWLMYETKFIGTKNPDREVGLDYPMYWYFLIIVMYAAHQICASCHFVSIMAFHAKVSDPEIGGTSMTLMNTVSNLGSSWLSTLSLYFVDKMSTFSCDFSKFSSENSATLNSTFSEADFQTPQSWDDKSLSETCKNLGGQFITVKDGVYPEVYISTILGVIWLAVFKKYMVFMDEQPVESWRFGSSDSISNSDGNFVMKIFKVFKIDKFRYSDDESEEVSLKNRGRYQKIENFE